ncbi:hypothetical protein GLX27_003231 [Malassezia furfur]|uniref:Protein yippee-like n=1 Tax=Malassezia furfur TaxID=55194 RepID=A0ABY8ESV9_MALFU|nr:hypothetical protein CBS14141_002867 [Malassezia furfur]WFD48561.1 hypothetical protein GLX27_003231 [Malassezia furfur]
MGMKHKEYLQSQYIYGCAKCKTHLTTLEALISKEFNGQMGRAYLFDKVVNVDLGEADDRHMRTGKHTVRDVACSRCKSYLGWKYDRAFVSAEKYKEGKFILEITLLDDVV